MASSAAEAYLGALSMNVKEGRTIRLTFAELGHSQPPNPIHCENATAAGISNGTIKKTLPLHGNTIFLRLRPSETQAI